MRTSKDVTFRAMGPDDLAWLSEKANFVPAVDLMGLVAEVNGHRAAIVAAERWSANSVWLHLVIANPVVLLDDVMFTKAAQFVFEQHGRKYMLTTTSGRNRASLRLQERLGFKEVGRIENGFDDGDDIVILRLEAGDWFKRRGH